MTREHPKGFVLVVVIWFVALLAFASAIIEGWVSGSLLEMSSLQDRVTAKTEMMSAANRVAYLMVSNFFSVRGLEILTGDTLNDAAMPFTFKLEVTPPPTAHFIALDGRPYRFGNGVIELQDERGLFSLTESSSGTFEYFLSLYGISSGDRTALYEKFLDYQAKGTFKSLQGASREDYARAGRPPPRAAPLITPWEPLRILGWDTQHMWTGENAFPEMVSIGRPQGINPNTAPELVLRGIPALTSKGVERLMKFRQSRPLHDFWQMQDIAGEQIKISPLQIAPFPSGSLRLKALFDKDPRVHILAISLTPTANAPFRIDFAVDLPRSSADEAAMAAPDLPSFPGLDQIP